MVHTATERRTLQTAIDLLPVARLNVEKLLGRVDRIRKIDGSSVIVDVGAAQGSFLIECAKLGYHAIGVEPWKEARETARRLAEHEGVGIELVEGVAEQLPLESESVDIVRANSLIEHVLDAQQAFDEAFRVLKPGGVFWFLTASSMCPSQEEIRGFPGFGWYPRPLKLRIMHWAQRHRPDLIGHTSYPALHWFTPWRARKMLREAGFSRIYDRWDLRQANEGSRLYAQLLALIRSSTLTKFVADILVPTCSYAAVKD